MKKFKLKKDLPFAKAGDMVEMWSNGTIAFIGEPNLPRFNKKDVRMFPLWFEEVEEVEMPDEFYIPAVYSDKRKIEAIKVNDMVSSSSTLQTIFLNNSEIGSAFKSKEEAERYIEYLKAKAIIKKDTKGFKPSLGKYDKDIYYFGIWDCEKEEPFIDSYGGVAVEAVKFKTPEDIEKSFKKHPEEWRKYLFYEQ